MKNLFLYIGMAAVLGGGLVTAYTEVHPQPQQLAINDAPKAGNFNPTGGGTYYLQGSINSSQTTITLASFTEPSSGIPYTMSYLNTSILYGTINPNSATSEFISFTGITQNPNGTAILTGVTRGLGRSYPYTASTTLAHSVPGQTQFILSAPPQFYNQYYVLANVSTSSNVLNFGSTTPPRYDADPVWANFSTKIFADVSYVNSVVAAGAANGSETVKGIYQLATAAQAAIGASIGSTGARLALGANLATTTPLFTGTNVIPMTGTNQKLSQLFLDLTQGFTFSTTTQYFANVGTLTATTSARLPSNTTFGLVPYVFPASQGVNTSVLKNDGSGNLSWQLAVSPKYTLISSTGVSGGSSVATSTALGIPAGTLTASSTIVINAPITACNNNNTTTATCTFALRDAITYTLLGSCVVLSGTSGQNAVGTMTMVVTNQSSLSSQAEGCTIFYTISASTAAGSNTTSALNTANAISLVLVASATGTGTDVATLANFSMVVTP